MNLSPNMQNALVIEIRNVAQRMGEAKTAQEKLYYFSAVFGMAHRIMNFEFDPELGFLHNVINNAYATFNTNMLLVAQGQSMPTFPPLVFEKLQEALTDLAKYIEEGKQTYPVLERISNLAYSTTGNGYYLYLKGILKLA